MNHDDPSGLQQQLYLDLLSKLIDPFAALLIQMSQHAVHRFRDLQRGAADPTTKERLEEYIADLEFNQKTLVSMRSLIECHADYCESLMKERTAQFVEWTRFNTILSPDGKRNQIRSAEEAMQNTTLLKGRVLNEVEAKLAEAHDALGRQSVMAKELQRKLCGPASASLPPPSRVTLSKELPGPWIFRYGFHRNRQK